MDFSRLPDTAFLKIFKYLTLEDCLRIRRVDKTFRRIAQLAISDTKSLDLSEDRFRNLIDYQLGVILCLCSPKLEQIKFPSRQMDEEDFTGTDWNACYDRENPNLDIHGRQLAMIFANYECPRMKDIYLGRAAIHYSTFDQLIRNNPKLESLIWREEFVGFPNVTNQNLKKLTLHCYDDTSVQSIIGHCPNLEELELCVTTFVTANVLNQVFASIPQVRRINLYFAEVGNANYIKVETELASLWTLPLVSLSIQFAVYNLPEGDGILYKVASSFSRLQSFRIGCLAATNNGIAALAALQDLQVLQLDVTEDNYGQFLNPDQGIRQLAHCNKLRKLDIAASNINGDTLNTVLRGCPKLDYIALSTIKEVKNPSEAVVVLEGLLGMLKRDITIEFHSNKVIWLKSIWEADYVKEMIKTLEENDELNIKFAWRWPAGCIADRSAEWQDME